MLLYQLVPGQIPCLGGPFPEARAPRLTRGLINTSWQPLTGASLSCLPPQVGLRDDWSPHAMLEAHQVPC